MKHNIVAAALVCILVEAAAGHAQEAVAIKIKTTGEGDSVLVSKNGKVTSKIKITDGQGNVIIDQSIVEAEKADFKETILQRDGTKTPTKLERAYAKAEKSKDDNTTDLELAGKTVVIEKTAGKYAFAFKGSDAVTGQALIALTKEFAKKTDNEAEIEKLVMPKNPVKPGESWKLDLAPIVKEIGKSGDGEIEMDAATATGTGTLTKYYKKEDGKLFGVMQFKLDIPVKTIGKGPGLMKFDGAAKMVLDLNLDVCIDGTAEAGTMKMKMVLAGNATLAGLPGGIAALSIVAEETVVNRDPAKK